MVFSDCMYQLNSNMKKEKIIVLVADENLYLLKKDKYTLKYHVDLNTLIRIQKISTNSSVFALIFNDSDLNLLIESTRRTEFLLFLLSVVEKRPLPQVVSTEEITIKAFGWKQEKHIEFNRNTAQKFTSLVSRDFLLSKKFGYLRKKQRFWWTEVFCVLSNIGVVIMKNSTDKSASLFPFVDFEVVLYDKNAYEF